MKRFLAFVAVVLASFSAFSQEFRGLTFSLVPHNVLVESAVEDGVFLLSHSYQLCDTVSMQKFGRYGQSEFGNNYALAVKVRGGFIVPESVVTPWAYDENFTRYQDRYKPVSYRIESRQLSDSLAVQLYEGAFPSSQQLNGSKYYFVSDTTSFHGEGFPTDRECGEKQGWCVWYTVPARSEAFESQGPVTSMTTKFDLTFTDAQNCYEVETPNTNAAILGGIYVVPCPTSIGVLTFQLAGIIVKMDETWSVITPFMVSHPVDELYPVDPVLTAVRADEDGFQSGN